MPIIDSVPDGADVLDLGSMRAARAEARAAAGKGKSFIKLSMGYVEVCSEIPISVLTDLLGEKIEEGLAGLLADPTDVALLLPELTANDLAALTTFITGKSLGE